jgi:type I restriction enzyme S subunit
MTDLPAGWIWAELGEIGDWYGGATPSKNESRFWRDGTVPWLSPKDMGADVLSGTQDKITASALEESPVRLVPEGSVALVVRSGILARKLPVTIVPFATALNQDMKAVIPRSDIDNRWIAWGIRAFEREILHDARKSGTTVASLEVSRLMRFKLPVAPLAEQQRVISAIEGQFSRIQSALGSLARAAELNDRMIPAALIKATGDQGGSAQWGALSIGELAKVSTGATPLKSRTDYYRGGTIPWVTSAQLNIPYVSTPSAMITELALKETSVKLFPPGTLLLAMYGEGKTRGRVSELQISSTTNQACAAIQLHPEYEDYRPWVKLVLESSYLETRGLAAGGVQPNLSLGLVRGIRIPLPPGNVRDQILTEIGNIKDKVETLRKTAKSLSLQAGQLRAGILRQAFDGLLLP